MTIPALFKAKVEVSDEISLLKNGPTYQPITIEYDQFYSLRVDLAHLTRKDLFVLVVERVGPEDTVESHSEFYFNKTQMRDLVQYINGETNGKI
jgi:hypothetical protein